MSKLNIEALTAARDLFLGLGDTTVHQAHWAAMYREDAEASCGSPACMGGWIAQSKHFREAGGIYDPQSGAPIWPATEVPGSTYYGAAALAMYFNLPIVHGFSPIAERLTDGSVSPLAYPAAAHDDREPTALEVAAALTSILDTGDLPCPIPL